MAKPGNDIDDYLEAEDLQGELGRLRSQATVQTVAKLVETLGDAIEDLQENKEFYDKELGKTIAESLTKLSESLKEANKPQDLSVISKSHESFIKANEKSQKDIAMLLLDVSKQNRELISAITKLTDKPVDDSKYQTMVREVVGIVKKSNDLITEGAKQIDYTKALEQISHRPQAWKMDVFYVQGTKKVDYIIATVIDPKTVKK